MDRASTAYRVHQCSECPEDTEYNCVSCPCNLCSHCKENHLKDLKTIDNNVVLYSYNCTQHEHNIQVDVNKACNTKLQEHRRIIHIIRNDALFYIPAILAGINVDRNTCHTEICFFSIRDVSKGPNNQESHRQCKK